MQLAIRNSLVDRRFGINAGTISGGDVAHRSMPAAPSYPETGTRARVSGDKRQPQPGRRLVARAAQASCRVPASTASEQPVLFAEAGRLPAPLWAALVLQGTLCG